MLAGNRICVVMPAYRAEKTLRRTCDEIDRSVVDDVLLVDDASPDGTVRFAAELGLPHVVHPLNRGYGGTQKTCYAEALARGADIVVMLHADYQYSPRLVPAMAAMIASGHFDVVLGSRILGTGARAGGMPLWKYVANRGLTFFENALLGANLSEYHTGFRAFARRVLETLPLEENSDDFLFDNQMLAQAICFGFSIGEISCPTRYFPEASTIGFRKSVRYGFGVLRTALEFRLARMSLLAPARLSFAGRRLRAPALPSRSSPAARAVPGPAPAARTAPRRPPPP
jgi:glycosyltransferase involved in cell wall biosynthesis